jgi:hypothetical protein
VPVSAPSKNRKVRVSACPESSNTATLLEHHGAGDAVERREVELRDHVAGGVDGGVDAVRARSDDTVEPFLVMSAPRRFEKVRPGRTTAVRTCVDGWPTSTSRSAFVLPVVAALRAP